MVTRWEQWKRAVWKGGEENKVQRVKTGRKKLNPEVYLFESKAAEPLFRSFHPFCLCTTVAALCGHGAAFFSNDKITVEDEFPASEGQARQEISVDLCYHLEVWQIVASNPILAVRDQSRSNKSKAAETLQRFIRLLVARKSLAFLLFYFVWPLSFFSDFTNFGGEKMLDSHTMQHISSMSFKAGMLRQNMWRHAFEFA